MSEKFEKSSERNDDGLSREQAAAKASVQSLRLMNARLAAQAANLDVDDAAVKKEFVQEVSAFGQKFPLFQQIDAAQAAAGLQAIVDTIRSPHTPVDLSTLRDFQYDAGAVWYHELLQRCGALQGETDRDVVEQANVARSGWLRRHADVSEAVTFGLDLYQSLKDPSKRSSVAYELAQAYRSTGNTEEAANWMQRSGEDAAAAGDERKGRMSRAEALKWLAESDSAANRDQILAMQTEFEAQRDAGESDEERDEGSRWVLNTNYWLALGAAAVGDTAELASRILLIDQQEFVNKGWVSVEQLTELKDTLRQLQEQA